MRIGLSGKVIVVTGAASGLGAAVARLAAGCDAGGLVLVDRSAEGARAVAEAIGAGLPVATVAADLGEEGSAEAVTRATVQRFGRIDGLVNSAALTTRASFRDGTAEVWDEIFAVNARAPFLLMQAAIRDMTGRGAPGAIVNILSMNALCGGPDLAIYSATKGALLTLTKNAAHAHMADRIRVNGINLGWTVTEAEHRMQAETLGQGPDWAARAGAGRPLGRLLQPEEAARLAVFLLSDLSAPLSGAVIDLEQWVAGAPPG